MPVKIYQFTLNICLIFLTLLVFLNISPLDAKKNKMSNKNADFLSKVRYIITKKERKYFKNLPDNMRVEFIKQFWLSRDTDDSTGENEFKDEYFHRIIIANQKFTSGRDGWLTDRGKSYILLGPPNHISEYPNGNYKFPYPYEIWHYPETFLYFVDRNSLGDYQVNYLNLGHQSMVHKAFIKAKRYNNTSITNIFDYKFKIKKKNKKPNIIFNFDTDQLKFIENSGKMESNFEININIKDKSYKVIWSYSKIHTLSISTSDPNKKIPRKYKIEIPLIINKGKYLFQTSVKRQDDKKKTVQTKFIKIK